MRDHLIPSAEYSDTIWLQLKEVDSDLREVDQSLAGHDCRMQFCINADGYNLAEQHRPTGDRNREEAAMFNSNGFSDARRPNIVEAKHSAGHLVKDSLSVGRVRQFLKERSFLGNLSNAAFESVVRRGRIKTYSIGDFICRREEHGETLVIIIAGWVKITNCTPDGKEVVLNFLGPGDTSGEIAVFDGKGRTADAVALEATEAFIVYGRDLLPTLSAHPQALLEIIQSLCERLRLASAIIEDNSLDMRRRIAKGLLRLATQYGRITKEGICVDLTVSQTELGAYLSLSRENVNRQLSQLRNASVIRNEGQQIIVTDEFALREIAEGTSMQSLTAAGAEHDGGIRRQGTLAGRSAAVAVA